MSLQNAFGATAIATVDSIQRFSGHHVQVLAVVVNYLGLD